MVMKKETIKAVIPAAGLGTRFLPATKAQPKEMLPLIDKPTIQFVVEEAIRSGITDILIITGRGKRAIEDHFDKSFELEYVLRKSHKTELLKEIESISDLADIHYVRQKERKGLGHAIQCAQDHVGNQPFAVLLGDTLVDSRVPCTKQMIEHYRRLGGSVIAVEPVPRQRIRDYGIVDVEKLTGTEYLVRNLVEKPSPSKAPSNLGIIGRYVLTPEIFDALARTPKGKGGEIQLTDAIKILNGIQDVYACTFKGKRYDIGDKLDYIKASIEYGLKRRDLNQGLRKYLRGLK